MRKELERWESSLGNVHLTPFYYFFPFLLLWLLLKPEKGTVSECSVKFPEEREFVEIVTTLSLHSEIQWHNCPSAPLHQFCTNCLHLIGWYCNVDNPCKAFIRLQVFIFKYALPYGFHYALVRRDLSRQSASSQDSSCKAFCLCAEKTSFPFLSRQQS